MTSEDQVTLLFGLLAVNALLYGLLLFSAFARRKEGEAAASNLADAFLLLEQAILENVPEMPAGFTWHEALERLRAKGVGIDLFGLESALKTYEAYRYGGSPPTSEGFREVLDVANLLRGAKVGRGPQG